MRPRRARTSTERLEPPQACITDAACWAIQTHINIFFHDSLIHDFLDSFHISYPEILQMGSTRGLEHTCHGCCAYVLQTKQSLSLTSVPPLLLCLLLPLLPLQESAEPQTVHGAWAAAGAPPAHQSAAVMSDE